MRRRRDVGRLSTGASGVSQRARPDRVAANVSVRPVRHAARMKLLTATSLTQGERDNDYHWCVEGELIRFDVVCGRSARNPDDRCGCGRGFAGMSSMRATTTALVRDLPMERLDVQIALAASLHAAGYLANPNDLAAVADEAEELIGIAYAFDVGDVIERRLDLLRVRASSSSR